MHCLKCSNHNWNDFHFCELLHSLDLDQEIKMLMVMAMMMTIFSNFIIGDYYDDGDDYYSTIIDDDDGSFFESQDQWEEVRLRLHALR